MNKTELIAAVAEKAEISKKDAEGAVNAMIDTIIEAVALEDKVQIVGFGTFECRTRNEKRAKTQELAKILSSQHPRFLLSRLVKHLRMQPTHNVSILLCLSRQPIGL